MTDDKLILQLYTFADKNVSDLKKEKVTDSCFFSTFACATLFLHIASIKLHFYNHF